MAKKVKVKKNFRDALKDTAGGWVDTIDCEKLKKNIYAGRLISTERRLTMPKQVILEFPVEFPEEVLKDKEVIAKAKEVVVLELLRKTKISQGKAAELLGIDRYDLFDLMAEHNIPMANFPPEELERQREYAEKKGKKSWYKDTSLFVKGIFI